VPELDLPVDDLAAVLGVGVRRTIEVEVFGPNQPHAWIVPSDTLP
jgi:hypothetical protein